MSTLVYWNQLTPEQQSIIGKFLVIKPKQSYHDIKKNKWKKWAKKDQDQDDEKGKTVMMYCYDTTTDIIKLPYKFSEKLLGKNLNIHKSLYNNVFNFNASLFDNQIDLYNDAWNYLIKNNTLNFCPFTGSGKTAMAIKMTADLSKFQNVGVNLVIMTITSLLPQWADSIKQFTDAIPYIVDSAKFQPPTNCNYLITTPGMIVHIPQIWRYQIGVLIIDEAHTMCSLSRVNALLYTQPKYVIACTATFERDDEMHAIIESITGTDKTELLSKNPFKVFKINTGCDMPIPENKFGENDWTQLVNMLANDEYRNNLILEFVKINHDKHKMIIFTLRQEHAKFLNSKTLEMGIKSDFMVGNKKNYNDSNVLYGSIQKLGTGFDEKMKCLDFNGIRIDYLLLCFSIKSLPTLKQVSGRVTSRAKYPNIGYLVDDNHISEGHFKKGAKWFTSANGTIEEINTHRHIENMKNKQISGNKQGNNNTLAYKQALEMKKQMEIRK